jgi:hypothetical protein
MAKTVADTPDGPGLISADVLYTLPELKKRLQLGDHAMRTARRKGLVVTRIGRRGYVLGKDVMTFVASLGNSGS